MAVAERVLLASVPTSEAAYARHHLPSAMVTPLPPSLALAAAHPEIEVLSVSSQDLVEPHVLARWSRLKAVVTRSNGTDHLPLEWLRAAGVSACHLGGYSTASVIEHTLALILALVRRIPEARESTQGRAPLWERARVAPRALAGLTVGILGTGRIGGGLARRLVAMDVKVVGHDLVCDPLLAASPGFRYADGLDDLLASAEVLTLHVPLTPLTRGLVDARHLAMLPTGALLVNTARGALVAQDAVRAALDAGRLAGYAADVLPGEPRPPDLKRFMGDPRVILTPHTAAYDPQALAARYRTTAEVVQHLASADPAGITPYLAES